MSKYLLRHAHGPPLFHSIHTPLWACCGHLFTKIFRCPSVPRARTLTHPFLLSDPNYHEPRSPWPWANSVFPQGHLLIFRLYLCPQNPETPQQRVQHYSNRRHKTRSVFVRSWKNKCSLKWGGSREADRMRRSFHGDHEGHFNRKALWHPLALHHIYLIFQNKLKMTAIPDTLLIF